jgi:predicted CoA-binding protein
MQRLRALRRILAESSDRSNPEPERIEALFQRLHRIAVVGLSRDPSKAARRVPSYLAAQGYEVIPVNPHANRMMGRPAVARLADVDDHLDLVVVFRPSDEAGAIITEAAARPGRPAIWLQEGIRSDDEAAAARAQGRLVVQDLCTYKVHRAIFT